MIFLLISIYIYYGYFYYNFPLSNLLTKDTFLYLTQNLLSIQWLWNNINLYDLLMISITYSSLWILYIIVMATWASFTDGKEDLY